MIISVACFVTDSTIQAMQFIISRGPLGRRRGGTLGGTRVELSRETPRERLAILNGSGGFGGYLSRQHKVTFLTNHEAQASGK